MAEFHYRQRIENWLGWMKTMFCWFYSALGHQVHSILCRCPAVEQCDVNLCHYEFCGRLLLNIHSNCLQSGNILEFLSFTIWRGMYRYIFYPWNPYDGMDISNVMCVANNSNEFLANISGQTCRESIFLGIEFVRWGSASGQNGVTGANAAIQNSHKL